MSTLYVSEYQGTSQPDQIAQEPSVNEQSVAIGASSAQSAAFSATTTLVRVHTDAICSILFGTNPTAVATAKRMAANQTEYFSVPQNRAFKIAVITNT